MGISSGQFTNRLRFETSPYLLQHAAQPVEWMPWSEEAFSLAQREDKPIFLSIGYSSCHWCHVMAEESFADPGLAHLMNRVFVNIKVDREERPDIDQLYMAVCQMMTGSGGWPLTVILMPDKRPVYAATYLPKHSMAGRIGMYELCRKMAELWLGERDQIDSSAAQIADSLRQAFADQPVLEDSSFSEEMIALAFEAMVQRYDTLHGGFGLAPKFPSAHNLLFLMRYWQKTGSEQAKEMVRQTLKAMRQGGIFDQLGYGFHRYSTDRKWRLPHFEKMLYDQALMAMTYIEAYQCFGDPDFAETARQTISYAVRSLRAPQGGFLSAEDADSEGEEGKFYTWRTEDLELILDPKSAALAIACFSMQKEGNFAEERSGERTGANVLLGTVSLGELAAQFDIDEAALEETISRIRSILIGHRRKRQAPSRDDKILTDWNGLMIAALAKAGRVLHDPAYAETAREAADFILRHSLNQKLLSHCYCKEKVTSTGFLDDYAFFAWGLYELYQTTFEGRFLAEALRLTREMVRDFSDAATGGLFFSRPNAAELFATLKETADGAFFSGASVALFLLQRFAALTNDASLKEAGKKTSRYLGKAARQTVIAHNGSLLFNDLSAAEAPQVVLCGSSRAVADSALLAALRSSYRPDLAIYQKTEDVENILPRIAPYTSSYSSIDGRVTAYLCKNRTCLPPITDAEELIQNLRS